MSLTFTSPDHDSDQVVDALAAAGFAIGPATPLVRTVFDTFDGRLYAARLHLERREDDESVLVLTAIAGDDPVGSPPAHLSVTSVPRMAQGLPPGPLRNRISAVTQERALVALMTVTTSCRVAERRDRRGKVTATVTVHDGLTVDGVSDGPSAGLPAWVAEVGGTVGHDDVVDATVARLRRLGLQPTAGDLVELAATAAGVDLAGHSGSPTVPMDPHEPALDAYRRVLAHLAETVVANTPGTIDDLDPEFLHELRVAVRRTRSVLAQGRKVLPDDVRDRYREEFGWMGTATGPSRDLDVYVIEWDGYISPLPDEAQAALARVLQALETRRRQAHATLVEALRSDRFRDALDAWQAWLREPDGAGPKADDPIGPFVARRITKAQATLLEDGRAITRESPAERLHDLRKDAKKLRYLLECFGSLLDTKERKAFVKRLKALQDNLGEHQDAEVHVTELRDLAHDLNGADALDTDALLAMGQLTAHLEQRRLDQREAFYERFAAYDTPETAAVLDDLLRGASDV